MENRPAITTSVITSGRLDTHAEPLVQPAKVPKDFYAFLSVHLTKRHFGHAQNRKGNGSSPAGRREDRPAEIGEEVSR